VTVSSIAHAGRRFVCLLFVVLWPCHVFAADKLVGIHSARTMSESMPSIQAIIDETAKADRGPGKSSLKT
jgi:hypothetical protein